MNLYRQLCASSVTFRDEPLAGALYRLRRLGFSRVDLTAIRHYCDHFDPLLVDVGERACLEVRAVAERFDTQIISLTTSPGNPLAPELTGDDWVEGVDAYVRLGRTLGSRLIVVPPGSPAPPPDRWRGTLERARPWLRDAVHRVVAAGMDPAIALQAESLLRTGREGLEFLRLFGEPSVGLAIDPAHLQAVGEDPAPTIRALGAAIGFVVLRDTDGESYNLPPGAGTLDYPAILAALNAVDYTGPLVLAIDDVARSPAAREDALRRGWDYLDRQLVRKAA
jgi:sugar phosphate isomerase/epimerase